MNGWPWPVEVNTHKVVETEDTKGISFKYFQNNKNIYKIEKIKPTFHELVILTWRSKDPESGRNRTHELNKFQVLSEQQKKKKIYIYI